MEAVFGLTPGLLSGCGGDGLDCQSGPATWFKEYNRERPQQALNYQAPWDLDYAPKSYGAKSAKWRDRREGFPSSIPPQNSCPTRGMTLVPVMTTFST